MFEELERVKAERDLYFEKLMRVRERIEIGKSKRGRNAGVEGSDISKGHSEEMKILTSTD